VAEEAEDPMINCPHCDEPIRDPAGYQGLLARLAEAHDAEGIPSKPQLPNEVAPCPTVLDEES